MAKRAKRPTGRGNVKFLRDSGQIRKQINQGKRELAKALSPDQESKALAIIQQGETALTTLSQGRFENLAHERANRALRAMDDLVKLTQQRRYAIIISAQHRDVIINELQGRFEAVKLAFNAVIENQSARQMMGGFVAVSMFRQTRLSAAE
jgi:hypothetical protein